MQLFEYEIKEKENRRAETVAELEKLLMLRVQKIAKETGKQGSSIQGRNIEVPIVVDISTGRSGRSRMAPLNLSVVEKDEREAVTSSCSSPGKKSDIIEGGSVF